MHYLRKKISHDKWMSWAIQFQTKSISIRRKKNDKDNKRKWKNNNDNNNNEKYYLNVKNKNNNDKHNIYIVINLHILTIINVMFCEIIHWILNIICFQHNIQNRLIFISYTFFSKFVRMNDLDKITTTIKQKTLRIIYKIDIKRINIFF